ncbi:MAG TPA: discoidin domain-containing protein [Bryobacteraceae bacterium]|nr:discoidin domain-containing protein [Bryobacteraceae bacterium]
MRPYLLITVMALTLHAQPYTLGVGVYPGNPSQNFAPIVQSGSTYRNIALHRPAYQSSSYDYNLTAQLVTDGIKDTRLPRWVSVSTSEKGVLPRNEREWLLDGNWVTSVNLPGHRAWVQVELGGGDVAPEIDRIDLDVAMGEKVGQREWKAVVSGSDDGQTWKELSRATGQDRWGGRFAPSVPLAVPSRNRFYRIELDGDQAINWQVSEVSFFDQGRRLDIGGPYDFTSAWKSAGTREEWVYVDLGAVCEFDRVTIAWIRRAAEGTLQASDDAVHWKSLQPLADDMKLAQPAHGRYVRLLLSKAASPEGYILSEMEVYGRGGLIVQPKPAPPVRTDGRLDLAGGQWRIQRDSLVSADGLTISKPSFQDTGWLVATVPGTVLTSYYNAGAIPDPNFGDNQLAISDSFFYADFWYRNRFPLPAPAPGRHVWLNFDGINWKAEVFLNGAKLGRIDGGFMRGRFDVTKLVTDKQDNVLAVRVMKNATPGAVKEKTFDNPDKNGGALGADNPTYHASVGWDWIPTIRGRNTGIWNNVYLTTNGSVTVDDPSVGSALQKESADVAIEVTLRNHDLQPVSGTLHGRFGDISFDEPVSIEASSAHAVKHSVHLDNPRLWWPNDYGDPNLYPVILRFETADHTVSDAKAFQAGVRQFTYSEEGGALKIWINGRRFIPRGGNWGFSESMLRYRAREYDAAVRYHRDMHFNMIRNWVGQIGEDAFYEACDRHGIVVWQDFWLANPYDGPDPDDNDLFMRNATDTVLRIRTHPSIGLYCGRNEGYPPKPLEDGLRATLAELHPGLHYISSSADDVVSGHGPYRAQPLKLYFSERATPKFHSEMGMPDIVSMDSLRAMMPESGMWPQGRMWGLHDFSLHGAQGGESFIARIDQSYGGAQSAADWVRLAQYVNYEGYRAMFEAQSKNRMGLLIWMSHPTWPSFVWQTYDYYFEPTAAYFGAKKASEPLHIQWNPVTDNVEVVNYSAGGQRGLTATVELLNMDGTLKWQKSASVDSVEDSVESPVHIEYPDGLTPVHFIRLRLLRGSDTVSDNFYWRGLEEYNYRALKDLPKPRLEMVTRVDRQSTRWLLTTELHNTAKTPALMVKLKVVREKSGDRILPAIYSDNYVALMPGERCTIRTEVASVDTRGENPKIVVE